MKNKDYEQLYYDEIYKNKKLENKIAKLETELNEINICRTKRNIDLQYNKYQKNMLKIKNERK